MTSIGCRCKGGNVYSRAILITQPLSGSQDPQEKPGGIKAKAAASEVAQAASRTKQGSERESSYRKTSREREGQSSFQLFFTLHSQSAARRERDKRQAERTKVAIA